MILLTLAAFAGAAYSQQPAAAPAPADYRSDANWLCLPGQANVCTEPTQTVELPGRGYGRMSESRPATNPRADCFYVYPTVSSEPGMNSDLIPGPSEQGATRSQAARFSEVCRVFAPMYRQVTGVGLASALTGGDISAATQVAYQDVRAAFREFRQRRAPGRPFLLVGHSQGSIHLLRLLQEEIEGKPAARDMVAAYLIGWNVPVPAGQVVGGALRSTPLCTRSGETGCVVTYMSFRESVPPEENGLFGRSTATLGPPVPAGMTAGCVNPATLTAGPALMDSIWTSAFTTAGGSPAVEWSSQGPPSAPFVRTYGLVTARCVNRGTAGYLAVRVNADPADPRTDRIPGDVALLGTPAPSWGLHPVDMAIGMGDLVRLARTQIASFRRR